MSPYRGSRAPFLIFVWSERYLDAWKEFRGLLGIADNAP